MKKVLAIVGPTASGKTSLSIELAARLNGEIISADSRQVFKYIPIATSAPSSEDLKRAVHYFVDELDPGTEFSAGVFGKKGRDVIDKIFKKHKQPIVAGGSGLYIRSLIDGFFEEEIRSQKVRSELYEKLASKGEEYLYEELSKADPDSASKIPPGKIRRVIRALEVYHASGKKISELQENKISIDYETIQYGLMYKREDLYRRINQRVDNMVACGLIDEVRWLKENGYHYKTHISLDTVGVKEVFKYFEGELDYVTMISLIKQNSRRYAKRQFTWFRKDKRINWIDVSENTDVSCLANDIVKSFNHYPQH